MTLDVHFTSPAPVYGLLGARASSPLLKQAGRLRSQGTGSEFTKQTSSFTIFRNIAEQNGYYGGYRAHFGDFNGDGRTDILWDAQDQYGRSQGDRKIWFSQINDFTIIGNVAGLNGYYGSYRPYVGDFDGDGRTDILWDHADQDGRSTGADRQLWFSQANGTFRIVANVAGQNGHYSGYRAFLVVSEGLLESGSGPTSRRIAGRDRSRSVGIKKLALCEYLTKRRTRYVS